MVMNTGDFTFGGGTPPATEPTTLPELRKRWPGLSREQIIWKALNAGLVVVKAKRGKKVDKTARIYRQKEVADRRSERMKTRAERAAEMAAMRPEHTHKQIGELWGMTRERVRQILKEHGYHDLLSARYERIEKICPQCGGDFGAEMGACQAKTRMFCDAKCFSAHASSHMTEREREVVTTAVRLRSEDLKWREIAQILDFAVGKSGTGLPRYVRIKAAKENIDVSAAFGFTAKRNERAVA